MAKMNFEQVVQAIRELEPAEQMRLFEFLSESLPLPSLTEEEWEQEMLQEGVLDHIPRKMTPEEIEAYRRYQPVEIKGEPLSETIIRERR